MTTTTRKETSLIPAPSGIVARYKLEGDGRVHFTEKAVIDFDDDGHPLVVGDGKRDRSLARADVYANYDGLGDDPYPSVVTLLPAGGWRVAWPQKDGTEWSQPLVGWGLHADGSIVPLDTDATGSVEELDSLHGDYRIYHPDQQGIPAPADAVTGAAVMTGRTVPGEA